MIEPQVNDFVRLAEQLSDVPLDCGTVGVVRSIWLARPRAFEVEFHAIGADAPVRVLVKGEQLLPLHADVAAIS